MIKISFNIKDVTETLNNLIGYTEGFVETMGSAESQIAAAMADEATEAAYGFIDSMARSDPSRLHHVYEWGEPGNAAARLYNIKVVPSRRGEVTLRVDFLQSRVQTPTSDHIFYNKAMVMEAGRPLTIAPTKKFLVFEGKTGLVFTTEPVTVQTPGGPNVAGSLEEAFDQFSLAYNSMFKKSSTVMQKLKNLGSAFRPRRGLSKGSGKADAAKLLMSLHEY